MTLKQWKVYHESRLEKINESIAKCGEDNSAHEYNYAEDMIEQFAVRIEFSDHHVLYRDDITGDWIFLLPDGSTKMNELDGKTPYFFGHWGNALYLREIIKGIGKEFEEQIPVEVLRATQINETTT